MVLSFVLMSTLDPMVAPRDLVSSFSSPLMMLVTPSNNSMVTIGKDAHLKFARTVSLALLQEVSEVVEASVPVVDLAEDLEAEEALVHVVDLVVDLAEDVVVVTEVVHQVVVMEEVPVDSMLVVEVPLQPRQTPSPTSLLLEPIEARSSMSAT